MNLKNFKFDKKALAGVLTQADKKKKKNLLIYGGIAALAVFGISYLLYKKSHYKPPGPAKPPSHFVLQEGKNFYKEQWRETAQKQIAQLQQQNLQLQQELQNLQNNIKNGTSSNSNTTGNQNNQNNQSSQKSTSNKKHAKKGPPLTSLIVPPPSGNSEVVPPPPPPPPPPGAPPGTYVSGNSSYGNSQKPEQPKFERLHGLIVVKNTLPKKKTTQSNNSTEQNNQPVTVKEEIPAGSFVRGILLSGVDAPVGTNAQGNPMPVLIRIVSRSVMPNFWKANIRNCFAIGSGYGDLASERVYVRLNLLSCITEDGHVLEENVKGYVAGRDGRIGIKGRVVSKQGQLIGRAIIAGFVQGLSQIFNYSMSTVTTSPLGSTSTISPNQALQAGALNGASVAAQQIAKYYMQLVNMSMPVVEVNAGQPVDIVFLSPVTFKRKETLATANMNVNKQVSSNNGLIKTVR